MAKLTRYPAKPKTDTIRRETAKSRSVKPGRLSPPRPRKNRKRKNWFPVIRNWFVILCLVSLVVWLCVDKRFHIRDVEYDGAQTVPISKIAHLAGVRLGPNLFIYALQNHTVIGKRIEAGEPAIEVVHIQPRPPHTLVIKVQERSPYAQLRINQGPLLLVDPGGVPYRVMPMRAASLPVIIVPAGTPVPILGKKMPVALNNPIGVGLKVVGLLEHGGQFVPLKLRQVSVSADLYTIVIMNDRPAIRIGLPDHLPLKLSAAAAALNGDPNRAAGAEYVDVTVPTKPAIKMKDIKPNPGIMD